MVLFASSFASAATPSAISKSSRNRDSSVKMSSVIFTQMVDYLW